MPYNDYWCTTSQIQTDDKSQMKKTIEISDLFLIEKQIILTLNGLTKIY